MNTNISGAQRRSSWLLPLVIVLILAEFWVIVKVATHTGVAVTILILICVSVFGASLTRSQWQNFALRMQSGLTGGANPEHMLSDTLGLLLAGIFLLIPGFLTSLLGLALLIPPLRHAAARFFMRRVFGGTFTTMGNGHFFGGMAGFGHSRDGSGPTVTVQRWSNENSGEVIDVTPGHCSAEDSPEATPEERGPFRNP